MLGCDQRPSCEAAGWVWPTDKPDFPCCPICSWPDNSFLLESLHFSPHALCSVAVLTSHCTLFTFPILHPAEMGGKWRRKGRHKSRSALSPISATKWVICECSWIIYRNGKLVRKRVRHGYCPTELRMWGDAAGKITTKASSFFHFFHMSCFGWNGFYRPNCYSYTSAEVSKQRFGLKLD